MGEYGCIGPVRVPPRIEDEVEQQEAALEAWRLYEELLALARRRGWETLERALWRIEEVLPGVDEQ